MFFIVFLIVLSTLVCLCYWYFTKEFDYWLKRGIPFVKPYPFVGNIYSVITEEQSIGEFLASFYKKTTLSYFGFFILNQPCLLLRDPEVIKNVLIRDDDHFSERNIADNKYDRFGQYSLFLSTGEKWKPLRTSITSLFSTGKNKSMLPLISEVSDRLVKCINNTALNQKSTNCHSYCTKYAVDLISNCFFGLNAHSLDTEDSIFLSMTKRFAEVKFLRNIQMASYFIAPFLVKLFRMKFLDPTASHFMRDVFFRTLEERKLSQEDRGDLIDLLLKAKEQQPDNISSDDKLAAMFIQFLTAGFETSENFLAFAIFELSRHQDVQTRLRNEIKETLKLHGDVTYDALQTMKYLDMVVKETSRKYPLLPFLDRRCVKTYKLPGHDLVIEKGRGVYISVFGLHYDPKYFPNPEKFDPDRFSENLNSPPCTLLPFGSGLRHCMGSRFAILSTKLVLVKLLLNFHIDKSEDATDKVSFAHNWIFLVPEKELNVCFKHLN